MVPPAVGRACVVAAPCRALSDARVAAVRGLPPCEQKLYDQKQYKKAVKEADRILKTNANHAGTTAIKALCLSLLGKRPEALVLAKEAVKNGLW
jgi:hypothetical protein